jgi:hypothetical protein
MKVKPTRQRRDFLNYTDKYLTDEIIITHDSIRFIDDQEVKISELERIIKIAKKLKP